MDVRECGSGRTVVVVLAGDSDTARNRVALSFVTSQATANRFRHITLADALYEEVATGFRTMRQSLLEHALLKQERFAFRHCQDEAFVRWVQYHLFQQYDLSADEMRELPDLPQSPRQLLAWWRSYRLSRNEGYWAAALRRVLLNNPGQNFVVSDLCPLEVFDGLADCQVKRVLVREPCSSTADNLTETESLGSAHRDYDYVIDNEESSDMLQFFVAGLIEILLMPDAATSPLANPGMPASEELATQQGVLAF